MIPLNLNDIQKHLKEKNYDVQFQEEHQQLYIVFREPEGDFPLFIKVANQLLQILIFLPCRVLPDAINGTARLLLMLNREMDVPGFGMDEGTGVVYFRFALPTTNDKIDPKLLEGLVLSAPRIAHMFFPIVRAGANGMPFEKMKGKVKEALKKLAQQ